MKKLSVILGMIVLALSVNAQNITLSTGSKGVVKSNDRFSGFQVTFSYNEIESMNITGTERGTFSALTIAEAMPAGEVGTPQLPVFKKFIAVPVGATPKVKVKSYTTAEYSLADYGIHTVFPVQPDVPKNKNLEDAPFVYDEKAYALDQYTQSDIAKVEVLGTMRGVRMGMLAVFPVQYNPVAQTIMVYNDIEVEVTFENGDYQKTEELYVNTFSPYFEKNYDVIFNRGTTRDLFGDHPDLYKTPVHMLVLTHSMFTATLQPWLEWKTQKGFYVDVENVDGMSYTQIKTLCQTKYNQGAGNGTAPTFVIIVGDIQQVPASKTGAGTDGNKGSDLYYGSIDGDYFPEMYYSRLSAQTTQQLQNQLDKILYYEKYQFADPTYLDNVLLIAGWDASWNSTVAQPTINYASNYYYNTAHGYANIFKYLTNPYTNCYTNLNNVGFANYTAHGDITKWHDPEFNNSMVNSLTNVNKYFIAMGNCCLAADFNSNECLGEAMVRAQQKGAVGYIGSCPLTYWHDDLHFAVGAYQGSWSPAAPTLTNTKDGLYDVAFRDADFNCLSSYIFTGNLNVTYAINTTGYTADTQPVYYWEAYHVLGDGSMMPYNTQGADNTVTHLPVIYIGLPTYEVTAVAGSYVAISKDGVLLGTAVADASGMATVTLDPPIASGGNVDIVVTRNQYKPYMAQVPAAAQSGPYVVQNGYTVPEEEKLTYISTDTDVEIILKNVGIAPTTGLITVELACDDPQITLNGGAIQYTGVINPDGTATVMSNVTIANGISDGKVFMVDVTVTDGSKTTWESKLPLTAYAPKLSLEKVLVNGVENGSLAPGSLAIITTIVQNAGGADAYNVTNMLEINSPYLTLACDDRSRAAAQDLPAGESMEVAFYVIVSPDIPYGHEANLELSLTADYGISYNTDFKVSCSGADNYCVPGSTNCSSYNDRITSIQILKTSDQSVLLNNPSPTCSGNGYTDYTNVVLELIPGEQYTIKVSTGYQGHKVKGWIDVNGNNTFDSNEVMFVVTCSSSGTIYSANFTIPPDPAPGSQRFRIRTRDANTEPDACGGYSWGQTLDYTVIFPELYPRVQNVVAVLDNSDIHVTWEAPASGTPTGYNIYRDGNKLNTAPLAVTNFTEENVGQGIYAYSVTALYTGNKESYSEMSNVICYFLACEKPINLAGVAEGKTAVLTWDEPENIEGELLGYNLYRDAIQLEELFTELEYRDEGLANGTYVYKIRAVYDHCESEWTDVAVTIDVIPACEPPTKLEGTDEQSTAVLSWEKPENIEGELLGYNIYRDGMQINAEPLTELEYRDEGLENGTYVYQVSAVYDHCAESELTDGVAVTIDVTGIGAITADSFQVFPNPAHNELNITGKVSPTAVRLYNITGQLVYETDRCAAKMKISVADMPVGVYFIKIDSEYGSVTKKVVVD